MSTLPQSTTVYYLEMRDRVALRAKSGPAGFSLSMLAPPQAERNRRLYHEVGGPWDWTERLGWSNAQWHEYAERPTLETWIGQLDGRTVGYFELEAQEQGNVQIMYFGIVPEFIGQGLGGALLTGAVERAWSIEGTRRVWLHTCTSDHRHALANYRGRGFEIYKTQQAKN